VPLDAATFDPRWLDEGLIIDNFAGGDAREERAAH